MRIEILLEPEIDCWHQAVSSTNRVVVDAEPAVHDTPESGAHPHLTDGPFHERRAAPFGQQDPISMAVGHRESLRAGGADQHRWGHPRRLFQGHLRELDVGAAVTVSPASSFRIAVAVSASAARRLAGSAPICAIHSATP